MTRWTEEDLAAYERRQRDGRPLSAQHVPEAPRVRAPTRQAPRARGHASPLERELLGHLQVMQLAPLELADCAGAVECKSAFCAQHRFHVERRWRLDFYFAAPRLGIEIDGGIFAAENGETAGRHARGAGIISGFEKRNAAAELGIYVLCYGPPQVRSGQAADQIYRMVSTHRVVSSEGGGQ
jgi:hypothetical protein